MTEKKDSHCESCRGVDWPDFFLGYSPWSKCWLASVLDRGRKPIVLIAVYLELPGGAEEAQAEADRYHPGVSLQIMSGSIVPGDSWEPLHRAIDHALAHHGFYHGGNNDDWTRVP